MSNQRENRPRLPPRWFVRLAWEAHRGLYRVTGGRAGLWRPGRTRWGTLRLTATGRRTGEQRSVTVGYIEDGPNLVTLAMSGRRWLRLVWWLPGYAAGSRAGWTWNALTAGFAARA